MQKIKKFVPAIVLMITAAVLVVSLSFGSADDPLIPENDSGDGSVHISETASEGNEIVGFSGKEYETLPIDGDNAQKSELRPIVDSDDQDAAAQVSAENAHVMSDIPTLPNERITSVLDSELYSGYACLTDVQTGSVIAEKRMDERFYPASLTKLMTALVLIENADDLEAEVTVTRKVYDKVYLEGASVAGFVLGESARLIDMLYGILLPSGAEAVLSAADAVFGSEEALVEKMNERAALMGLVNTHFTNATGLHDDEHYSSAHDMNTILLEAMKNETFMQIAQSGSYSVPPTDKHPDGFKVYSTVFGKLNGRQPESAKILGGKTGYTLEAMLCLATFAEKNGRLYAAVTLGAEGTHKTAQHQVDDALLLYDNYA